MTVILYFVRLERFDRFECLSFPISFECMFEWVSFVICSRQLKSQAFKKTFVLQFVNCWLNLFNNTVECQDVSSYVNYYLLLKYENSYLTARTTKIRQHELQNEPQIRTTLEEWFSFWNTNRLSIKDSSVESLVRSGTDWQSMWIVWGHRIAMVLGGKRCLFNSYRVNSSD